MPSKELSFEILMSLAGLPKQFVETFVGMKSLQ